MPRKIKRRSSISKKSVARIKRRGSLKRNFGSKKKKTSRSPKFYKLKKTFCSRKKSQKKANHNLSKYVNQVNEGDKTCQIMTPHGNIIDLPSEYPGDDFVFSELYTNPEDKYHAEMVDSNILRDVYNKYHRMCF